MKLAPIARRWKLAGAVGVASALLVAALLLIPATNATSQLSGGSNGGKDVNVSFRYSGKSVDIIAVTKTNHQVRQTIPFPGQPAFIIQTDDTYTLYARNENAVQKILEIPMDEGTNGVKFLEDKRTFIVESKRRARVFSFDATVVYTDKK